MPRQIVDKDARRIYTCDAPRLEAKVATEGDGDGKWIEGYATAWGNVDLGDERMVQGAFAKSILERVPQGRCKLMTRHFMRGGDVPDCIGTITAAKEDSYGLWFHADLVPNDAAVDAAHNKVKTGHVGYASVGYGPVRWQWIEEDTGREVLEHLECKLYEATITVQPMNEMAALTAAKALGLSEDTLTTLGKLMEVDPQAPDGRQQLAALGKAAVENVHVALLALADKVGKLGGPQAAALGAADLHTLRAATARCNRRLRMLTTFLQ